MKFKASAPGTLMLLGEHAVLRNKLALCAATDQRIAVTITKRNDKKIIIDSALGSLHTSLSAIKIEKPFQFVLASLQHFQKHLITGLDISINSNFSHQVGLGSSAAVTVATTKAITELLTLNLNDHALLIACREIIQTVQGLGSGADVAASIYGGIVAYRMEPITALKLPHFPEISLVYSGRKETTATVVKIVNQLEQQYPKKYQTLFEKIDQLSEKAALAITEKNWQQLGCCMQEQQILMEEMGVSTSLLNTLIQDAENQTGILGAKISGSGLGDSIITLGKLTPGTFPLTKEQKANGVKQLEANIAAEGVLYECK